MERNIRQLPIPPVAKDSESAIELLRVWAANGKQHVTIDTQVWDDPATWGIMLVDLAKHVADALSQISGSNKQEVLRRIREGFDAEWDTATDEPTGKLVK